jgi:glycosyltransferase involved in cell wall biosynthesis
MTTTVFVDAAGGTVGGAGRFRVELYQYLARTGREDIRLIGAFRRIDPSWLIRRELAMPTRGRRVALNNLSFVTPGGDRWTRLGNPLDFLTDEEWAKLDPTLRKETRFRASIVRLAARRSDVIVTPSSAMGERVAHILPSLRSRIIPRLNPVSADSVPILPRESFILCPVIFSPYKYMVERLREWVAAVDGVIEPSIRMYVTATASEVPDDLKTHPRINLVGQLSHADVRELWARSCAIFFPTGLESFGFPLAEARVNGQPVIARDTEQNREIAGPALCGFSVGDEESLRCATELAVTKEIPPDPVPFEPDAYFNWLLGPPSG